MEILARVRVGPYNESDNTGRQVGGHEDRNDLRLEIHRAGHARGVLECVASLIIGIIHLNPWLIRDAW